MTATKHISLIKKEKYECQFNWGKGIYQCADNGLVLSNKGNYSTSYFEAFPDNTDDWYRGEGRTIEEAEKDCLLKFQKASSNSN